MAMIEMPHTVIDPRTVMVYQEKVSLQKTYVGYRNIPILSTHLRKALEHTAPCIDRGTDLLHCLQ
jgi:hypothetical protein